MAKLSLLSKDTINDLVVDIGDTPNDRTGDPLRTAFNKIKDSVSRAESNFDELYARTGDDIQIPALAGNTGKVLTTNGTTLSWSASNSSFNQSLNTTNSVTFNSVASSTVNVSQINGTNPGNELIIQANSRNWVFGTDGTLTLPNLGTVTNPSVVGSTGTIHTFTADYTASTPALSSSIWIDLEDIPNATDVVPGWVITFANNSQKTVTGASYQPPGNNFWRIEWSGALSLSAQDVWPITVQSADYTAGNTTKSLVLTPDGTTAWTFSSAGMLSLPNASSIRQNFVETKVTQSNIVLNSNSGVIWTANNLYASGVKLIIQAEIDETGDATGWHSQVCEAIVASRGYASSASGPLGDPQMTVYGITYTSTEPLITFTVQRDPITNLIEVTGNRTATALSSARVDFRIHSVEMSTSD